MVTAVLQKPADPQGYEARDVPGGLPRARSAKPVSLHSLRAWVAARHHLLSFLASF